ncbi:hypothetical protein KSF_112700 [Reticulibacter mediterranei]|uniref:Disease resistance R13L4/SHOC-2-like LRR domain-containing protein n=1 Tax=Reticulibacter mediterranei TaxID=2778369 RepID=A0A8J3NB87_9CHLR|nr:hypothetical protein KSF_074450 [Reticulibacter mediterranei]GHP01223.1 hypothetical protein KSF_112700 [Reticulibacter mediterranei]
MTELEELELRHHSFTHLPAEIGHLARLRTLSLRNNALEKLPVELGQLTNLDLLDLNENQLTELPGEIGQLSNLKYLFLAVNRLTCLPREIGQLTNLASLNLWGNQLRELPAEIGELRNLRGLDLRRNHLIRLPAEIRQLRKLEDLELENNQLTELPVEISDLKRLHPLNLDGNPIGGLPEEQKHLLGIAFEIGDYGGLEPLRALYDEVHVDHGLFSLVDVDGPPPNEEGAGWPFDRDYMVETDWVLTKPNSVVFLSADSYHYAWVRLEAWEHEAPHAAGVWDEIWEGSFSSSSGRVQLLPLMNAASRHLFMLGTAGQEYHLRVSCRGRQEVARVGWEDGSPPRGVEQYLMQFWLA